MTTTTDRLAGVVTGEATLEIVNPIAVPRAHQADAEKFATAKRPASLEATIAPRRTASRSGLHALSRVKENFSKLFPDVSFIEMTGELGGTTRYLSDAQLERLEKEADVAVCTSADCGSCTSWLMRDMCELERRGVPAVGYTAAEFDEDAHFSTQTFGVPDACPVIALEKLVGDGRGDRPDGGRPSLTR